MSARPLLTPRWHWEGTDPNRSGTAGDLAKLFRNDPVKQPGALAEGAPQPSAIVLAREVIQNAWDAAIERRDEHERRLGQGSSRFDSLTPPPPPPPPEFEVRFRYSSAVGERKRELFVHLGLDELKRRIRQHGDRRELGLAAHVCLDESGYGTPLNCLLVEETGTTGMYGPWEGAQSKLWLALCSTGYTPKAEGEGGSFGYGKAGLIGGSKIRMVIAYTCFEERLDDPGVTRRLLGMTYWGQHELGGRDFTGFARLGLSGDGNVHPFENDEADQAAALFGLDRRDAVRPEEWGTSLLLVDPTVNAFDLERAIARNWWPALEDGGFHVRIETAGGQTLHPRPKSDPVVAPFHDAYEVATGPQDSKEAHRRRHVLHPSSGRPQAGAVRDGVLGLVADPDGWSFPRDSAGVEHRSLVALVRRPRMVVEYLDVGRAAPFVRGVFVADDSINEQLRQTEPKGHDAWQTRPDEPESAGAFELAASIQTRIKQRAAAFRRDLKPPPRPAEKYQLKLFDREMRRLLGGTAPSGPPAQTRPLTIRIGHECRDTENGALFVAGTAEIGLSPHFKEDRARVKVQIRFTLLEDGKVGKDSLALVVDPPDGFETRNGSHEGLVHRGEPVRFGFRTESYRADWSGRLDVRADPVSGASDQPQEKQGEA